MDWTLAIERNTAALKRIVATLIVMAGLGATPTSPLRGEVATRSGAGGGDASTIAPTLPRRLHRVILRLLRPAESAVRRLIVIAARGLVVPPSPPRPPKPKPAPSIFVRKPGSTGILLPRGFTPPPLTPPHTGEGDLACGSSPSPLWGGIKGGGTAAPQRSPCLPLFDPLKRPFRRHRPTPICEPRISYPGPFNRLSPVKIHRLPTPDDCLDATRLTQRIQALAAALDDLPAHAQRLARWKANRDAKAAFLAPAGGGVEVARAKPETVRGLSATSKVRARPRHRRISPLRPGRPPGSLRRPDHEIHDLLTELHGLAFDAMEHPGTS